MKGSKKFLSVLMAAAMVATTHPVYAADGEADLSTLVFGEAGTISYEVNEPEGVLPELAEEFAGSDEEIPEHEGMSFDEVFVDEEMEAATYDASSAEVPPLPAGSKYYAQPLYDAASGYDILVAYIVDNGEYVSRVFLIHDQVYGDWLRYDYSLTDASTFLGSYEEKDGLYIPVQKDGTLKNDAKTALDESKIPLFSKEGIESLNLAWHELDDMPFLKDSEGRFTYAYYTEEDPGEDPEKPDDGLVGYALSVNDTSYEVRWMPSVVYNGKSHVLATASKVSAKQTADMVVKLYRSGAEVDAKSYSVAFKNNVNVNGYAGKASYVPYFQITLSAKAYSKDKAKLKAMKFGFNILPVSLEGRNLTAKKVVVTGSSVAFTKLYAEGISTALTAYTAKNKGGSFTAAVLEDGTIQIVGRNNYDGTALFNVGSPKKITYDY